MPIVLQGLTMGLAYVAPIGVQNLFVIHGALSLPRRQALLRALVVVFFDVSLALACFFGVGAVLEAFPPVERVVLLVGSLLVLAIALGLLRSKPAPAQPAETQPAGLAKTVSTAFVVTWCNPQALVDGTMMLGAFRAALPAAQSGAFLGGVVLASCLWFTGVTLVLSLVRRRISPKSMVWINRICGAVILIYGIKLLWSFFAYL